MSERLLQSFLKQMRQKANEVEYEVYTDFDKDKALVLSWLFDIQDKKDLNFEYPSKGLCGNEINEILNKNL